jgi:hypothetical protein
MSGAAKMRASDSRAGTKHQCISRLRCSAVGRLSLSWQDSIFMAGGAPWRMTDSRDVSTVGTDQPRRQQEASWSRREQRYS